MNPVKTLPKITAPTVTAPTVKKDAPLSLPPVASVNRLDRFLRGKSFHLLYRNGTRLRAGLIEEVIDQSWCLCRYYSLKTGELEPWRHLVKLFGENSSVETLEGFWIHEDKAALESCYKSFLASHLQKQAESAGPLAKEEQ